MIRRWITSLLKAPFQPEPPLPLVRPDRIDWDPSLSLRTLQVHGHSIFYTVKGEGEPILLVHGFGAGIWVWEKQMEALSRFYRVYAIDLIGHGYSDRPRIPYTPETYLHFLKAFLDRAGIREVTLIGNSMGGGIGWGMAILFPEQVKRLVLIDAAPPDVLNQVRNESFLSLVWLKHLPLLPRLVIGARDRGSVRQVLEECVFDRGLITPEVLERQYQLLRIEGTTWVLCSTLENAAGALRFKDRLSDISVPTLILWGEKDLIFPVSVGEGLRHAIPGSTLRVIERSGHIPMWETPAEVNESILSFLKKRDS